MTESVSDLRKKVQTGLTKHDLFWLALSFAAAKDGREVDWTSAEVLERMITEFDLINLGRKKKVSAKVRKEIEALAADEREQLFPKEAI